MSGSYGDAVAPHELSPRAPHASAPVTTRARTGPGRPRTLWEEGRHPGHRVVRVAALVLTAAAGVDLLLGNDLGTFFDVAFVLVCLGAALLVRPREFFTVGVLPPLLLAVTVAALALLDRDAVARRDDLLVQAFVSGLAHHALALVVGYALTLAVIGLRQIALRHDGRLRANPASAESGSPHVASQLRGQGEGQ